MEEEKIVLLPTYYSTLSYVVNQKYPVIALLNEAHELHFISLHSRTIIQSYFDMPSLGSMKWTSSNTHVLYCDADGNKQLFGYLGESDSKRITREVIDYYFVKNIFHFYIIQTNCDSFTINFSCGEYKDEVTFDQCIHLFFKNDLLFHYSPQKDETIISKIYAAAPSNIFYWQETLKRLKETLQALAYTIGIVSVDVSDWIASNLLLIYQNSTNEDTEKEYKQLLDLITEINLRYIDEAYHGHFVTLLKLLSDLAEEVTLKAHCEEFHLVLNKIREPADRIIEWLGEMKGIISRNKPVSLSEWRVTLSERRVIRLVNDMKFIANNTVMEELSHLLDSCEECIGREIEFSVEERFIITGRVIDALFTENNIVKLITTKEEHLFVDIILWKIKDQRPMNSAFLFSLDLDHDLLLYKNTEQVITIAKEGTLTETTVIAIGNKEAHIQLSRSMGGSIVIFTSPHTALKVIPNLLHLIDDNQS